MSKRPITIHDKLLLDFQHRETELLRYRWGYSLFASWLQFAIACFVAGVLININLHYIIGSIVAILSIIVIFCAIGINIAVEVYSRDTKRLLYFDSIFLWIIRIITLLGLCPLFLWTSVLMFQNNNGSHL